MSAFEQTYLFFEIISVGNATMANYMTLVFGMLVTSYLAAHRLDRVMMWIALVIYSMFALGFINEIFQAYSDFARLGLALAEKGQLPNADLAWFGPVAVGEGAMHVIPTIVLIMTLSAYIGSIAFFFRARKANLADHLGPVETAPIQAPQDKEA